MSKISRTSDDELLRELIKLFLSSIVLPPTGQCITHAGWWGHRLPFSASVDCMRAHQMYVDARCRRFD